MSNNLSSNNIVVNDDEAQVLICSERLKKLELLEMQLPNLIEAAINEHKIQNRETSWVRKLNITTILFLYTRNFDLGFILI